MAKNGNTCYISNYSWEWDFLPPKLISADRKSAMQNAILGQHIADKTEDQIQAMMSPHRSQHPAYSVATHGPILYAANTKEDLFRFFDQFQDKRITTHPHSELSAFYGKAETTGTAKTAALFSSMNLLHQRARFASPDVSGTGQKIGGFRVGGVKMPKFRIGTAGQKIIAAPVEAGSAVTAAFKAAFVKKIYFAVFSDDKLLRWNTGNNTPYLVHQQTNIIRHHPTPTDISLGKFAADMRPFVGNIDD